MAPGSLPTVARVEHDARDVALAARGDPGRVARDVDDHAVRLGQVEDATIGAPVEVENDARARGRRLGCECA